MSKTSKAGILKQLVEINALEQQKPTLFLAAWKKGIFLAGTDYFNIKTDLNTAACKEDLCPNFQIIDDVILRISRGEATFIAAMYSFYNSEDGQRMLEKLGESNICDIAARLDKERLDVILALMENYQGW